MRKIFLMVIIAVAGFIVACEKHDRFPPYSASTIFNVTASSISRSKDTVKSAGDTIIYTVKGGVYDTSKTYGISVSIKAIDSATSNILAAEYIKTATVTFDTVGLAASNLYRWTSKITFPLSPMAAKSKFKTSTFFTFGLNLSSQTGNVTASDSKFAYAK